MCFARSTWRQLSLLLKCSSTMTTSRSLVPSIPQRTLWKKSPGGCLIQLVQAGSLTLTFSNGCCDLALLVSIYAALSCCLPDRCPTTPPPLGSDPCPSTKSLDGTRQVPRGLADWDRQDLATAPYKIRFESSRRRSKGRARKCAALCGS